MQDWKYPSPADMHYDLCRVAGYDIIGSSIGSALDIIRSIFTSVVGEMLLQSHYQYVVPQ